MDGKEIQKRIVERSANTRATEEEFFAVLKTVAPGTNFRAALDGALKTGKGALIVVENQHTLPLFDGGFKIQTNFTPQKLIELTKMDGAIVLSSDMKRIHYANVLLTPSAKIPTHETGTRHKAAERTARQAGTLAIAISERRNEITLYFKNLRYPLVSTEELLRKANENIQLLEKQREIFDKQTEKLDAVELRGSPSLRQAISVIQKGRIIMKISEDLNKKLIELGREGTLLRMRLKEITLGVDRETELVVKDYTQFDMKKSKFLLNEMSYDSVLDEDSVASVLGYESLTATQALTGWRILSRTSLIESEIATIHKEFPELKQVLRLDMPDLQKFFDIDKAELVREELSKVRGRS